MKTWKTFAALMVAVSLLSGCNGNTLPGNDTTQDAESVSDSVSYEENPSEESAANLPPREGMVRSRITNEWVEEETADSRPIAVMIPNEVRAVPHYNLSQADVIYEAKVEGNMTRMMAVFEDWQNLNKIGNVRSLRSYFAYWAFEWDSIIVHYGGPYFIYDLIDQENTENIDGLYDSDSFYRTADRDAPHNAFTSGKNIASGIRKKEYSRSYRGLADETHFLFAQPGTVNTLTQYGSGAVNASHIDMTEAYPLTRCYFDYDEESGLYYRSQYLSGGSDGPHTDAATGKQLSFSNILVQHIKQEDIGNGYLAMQCHDTTKDGWFFTQGKGIHVTWEKTTDYGSTRFYDDNGLQIELNTGKTMILIIRDSDTFSYR